MEEKEASNEGRKELKRIRQKMKQVTLGIAMQAKKEENKMEKQENKTRAPQFPPDSLVREIQFVFHHPATIFSRLNKRYSKPYYTTWFGSVFVFANMFLQIKIDYFFITQYNSNTHNTCTITRMNERRQILFL